MPFPSALFLLEEDAGPNPFALFARWYLDAENAQLPEPSAMTLATVDSDGFPAARLVLMRGFDERGFVFYTNYQSRKAQELAAVPRAALAFFWAPLQRQVRIEGLVEKVAPEDSDAYFKTRPLGHRLSAWTSSQSQVIPDRQFLEHQFKKVQAEFQAQEIPRPPHWGGYRVAPTRMEFWQGRESRLHDRLQYTLQPDGTWKRERLAP